MTNTATIKLYDHELRVAMELAREAGAVILDFYKGPLDVEQKSSADDLEPVTQADRIANELIVSRLAREFPNDGIRPEDPIHPKRRPGKCRAWSWVPLDCTNVVISAT